jgi:hypothetical protein
LKFSNYQKFDLDRFKERHGIVCRSFSGESAVVDTDICDDWLKNKLPNLVKNYKSCDIFTFSAVIKISHRSIQWIHFIFTRASSIILIFPETSFSSEKREQQ